MQLRKWIGCVAYALLVCVTSVCSADLMPVTIDTFDSSGVATGLPSGHPYEVSSRTFTAPEVGQGGFGHAVIAGGTMAIVDVVPATSLTTTYNLRLVTLTYEFVNTVTLYDLGTSDPDVSLGDHPLSTNLSSISWRLFKNDGFLAFASGTWSNGSLLHMDLAQDEVGVDKLTLELSWQPPAGGNSAFVLSSSDLTVIPEPSTFVLCGIGALGLFGLVRFRRKKE